ncbi:alpha/beta hydrolase [Mycobacterium sp. Dal123C01]|uniref:alpha/beta hydrolase n=1 Tax=Mycobacterium sp. Dal123C01 TaxID=3457577 RepID=UPI00403E46CB
MNDDSINVGRGPVGRRRSPHAAVQRLATRMAPTVLPALPDVVKRLLSGGRRITIDGNTLDLTTQALLAARRAIGAEGVVVGDDVAATRTQMREACLALAAAVPPVEVRDLAIPGPAGPIPARHYRQSDVGPVPLLVFYHGGGFVFGDLDSYHDLCHRICRDGDVAVLSVDYRLAPEHKAPAAVDDAYAAYRWAAERALDLGAIPGRIAVGGDSAGGTLAAVVAQLARNDGGPLPALQWLICPLTDASAPTRSRTVFADGFLLTQHDQDWFHLQYLDGSDVADTDPRVAPLRAENLSGLPPALVITAGFDPLRDEGRDYAAALRAAGVAVDLREMGSLTHAFINFGGLGGAVGLAIEESIAALRAHLSGEYRHSPVRR